MKKTLLKIVQDMLVAIDAEEVNSVSDTVEAGMCVNIANRAFNKMITAVRWKHTRSFSRLVAGSNLNELTVPTGTYAIDPNSVYYDRVNIPYVKPETFLFLNMQVDPDGGNVDTINDLYIINDAAPTYWTSDDDTVLTFNSIPDEVDGLDASVSRAIVYRAPTSELTDDDEYFNLPAITFPVLVDLCVSMALSELKGDSMGANALLREYRVGMGKLATNARLVDQPDDIRDNIVARIPLLTVAMPRISN